jgi:hypothetical protein
MIVTVDSHFESALAHPAHHLGVATSDEWRGQQGAVEQRPNAVEFDDARATDLPEETGPKHPRDRAAGLIRTE